RPGISRDTCQNRQPTRTWSSTLTVQVVVAESHHYAPIRIPVLPLWEVEASLERAARPLMLLIHRTFRLTRDFVLSGDEIILSIRRQDNEDLRDVDRHIGS